MKIKAALILAMFVAATPLSSQTVERWQKIAVQKHPALAEAGSPLNQRFLAIIAAKRKSDPAYFEKPDWPVRAADAAAEELRKEELAAKEKAKADELAANKKTKADMERTESERARAEELTQQEKEWERDKARWVFERLVFGDSEEVIVRKLNVSKTVMSRVSPAMRVALGARYRWVIGESKFNMDFELKDGLSAIIVDSLPEKTTNLDSLTHEDWEKLRAAAIERFGQPTKTDEYPNAQKLRRGAFTVTDVWDEPNRRVRLGVTEDDGRCSATLRIGDPARGEGR